MNPLNLYLVERIGRASYDQYRSFVVACATIEQARATHPCSNSASVGTYPSTDWLDDYNAWVKEPNEVGIQLIGISNSNTPAVIHTSFITG